MKRACEASGNGSSVGANPSRYARLLGVTSQGRTTGTVRGFPTCKVVRSWVPQGGISKTDFEHVYDGVCGCAAMADTRKLIVASHAPESVTIKNPCLHMQTLKMLGSKFDSTPLTEYGPVAVVGTSSLSVADDNGRSRVIVVIDQKNKAYQCRGSACQYQKYTCSHVETIMRVVRDHDLYGNDPFLPKETEEEEEPQPPPRQPESAPASTSTEKVSLDAFSERVRKRRASTHAASQWLASGTNCVPDGDGRCPQCHTSWAESEIVVKEMHATLYGCYESIEVTVYERKCHCGETKAYDGLVDGVFNYSNKTLWLHETMLTYIDLMMDARMPFNAYYKVLGRQYERRGAAGELCSKSTVIASLEAFIQILDVDYGDCFTCPICSQLPLDQQMYIIDGKAMGFRWDLMEDEAPQTQGQPAAVIPGTRFAYIKGDVKAQKLCASIRAYTKTKRGIDDTMFNSIIRSAQDKAPELVDVLKYIKRTERDYLKCPQRYRQFLYDIATPCPISCLIPRALYTRGVGIDPFLIRMMDAKEFSQDQRTTMMEWGSFSELISEWPCIPDVFKPLLRQLCQLAGQLETDFHADVPTATMTAPGIQDDSMAFFPNHPRIREPRVFDEPRQDKEQTCTKKILKSRRFTPGLFSAFCPHGICIGFEAMRKFESARVPFELFYTRFASCPGYIVYDNACNASRYCLRREPFYFSRVRFFIDRMHQCNHVGCHSGYKINSYPQNMPILGGTMTLEKLNSQAAEQAHSKMTLIETQTSFMGQATFMAYTKLFMAVTNKAILKKL